jgi:hypothetical protein
MNPQEIIVRIDRNYGNRTVYPVCEAYRLFESTGERPTDEQVYAATTNALRRSRVFGGLT